MIENQALKMKVLTSGKTHLYLIKLPLLGKNTRKKTEENEFFEVPLLCLLRGICGLAAS